SHALRRPALRRLAPEPARPAHAASRTRPPAHLPHGCRCSGHDGHPRRPHLHHPPEPEAGPHPPPAAPKATARSAAIRHSTQPHAPPQNQAPEAPSQAAAPWRTPHGRAATPPPTTTTGPSTKIPRSPPKASPPPTADG